MKKGYFVGNFKNGFESSKGWFVGDFFGTVEGEIAEVVNFRFISALYYQEYMSASFWQNQATF